MPAKLFFRLGRYFLSLAQGRYQAGIPARVAEVLALLPRAQDALAGLAPAGSRPEEMAGYCAEALPRIMVTLDLVPPGSGRLLELGANPYFFTILLQQRCAYAVTLANYFGTSGGTGRQTMCDRDGAPVYDFTYDQFNVEQDSFPYPDNTFAVVVCGEIIEHLTLDPAYMLAEINRILSPGGLLILTTPNAVRTANLVQLLEGKNVHDQYSGYGLYGRHNREYTVDELREVVTANGFDVDELFTADVQRGQQFVTCHKELLRRLVEGGTAARGETIFLTCRKRGLVDRPVRPAWLYRSREDISC